MSEKTANEIEVMRFLPLQVSKIVAEESLSTYLSEWGSLTYDQVIDILSKQEFWNDDDRIVVAYDYADENAQVVADLIHDQFKTLYRVAELAFNAQYSTEEKEQAKENN